MSNIFAGFFKLPNYQIPNASSNLYGYFEPEKLVENRNFAGSQKTSEQTEI